MRRRGLLLVKAQTYKQSRCLARRYRAEHDGVGTRSREYCPNGISKTTDRLQPFIILSSFCRDGLPIIPLPHVLLAYLTFIIFPFVRLIDE